MKIVSINWLSESGKEAAIEISDGENAIIVFSQPCDYSVNQKLMKI